MGPSPDADLPPSGSQLFYDTAGSAAKTLKLYEGHYHDLLHDVGKEQVLADITSWITIAMTIGEIGLGVEMP